MNVDFFTSLHSQLGIMTWPLTLLSVIMFMIILERLCFTLLHCKTQSKKHKAAINALALDDDNALHAFVEKNREKKNTLLRGLVMLLKHRDFTKNLREESVSIWLQHQRRRYVSGLKVLNVIGVLTPLLGLLGTVLGLIEMFKGLSHTQGSISPAILADGLGLAMSTTAAGLLIAVPAIASAQLFGLWADRTLAKIEFVLNHFNLHLSGVSMSESQCKLKHCPPRCNAPQTTGLNGETLTTNADALIYTNQVDGAK